MMTHLVVNFAIQLISKRTDVILRIVVLDLGLPFIPPLGRFKLKSGFLSLSMFSALLNEVIYRKIPSSVPVPVLVTLSRTFTIPFPFRSHISLRKRSMPILYIWVVVSSPLSQLMSTHIITRVVQELRRTKFHGPGFLAYFHIPGSITTYDAHISSQKVRYSEIHYSTHFSKLWIHFMWQEMCNVHAYY